MEFISFSESRGLTTFVKQKVIGARKDSEAQDPTDYTINTYTGEIGIWGNTKCYKRNAQRILQCITFYWEGPTGCHDGQSNWLSLSMTICISHALPIHSQATEKVIYIPKPCFSLLEQPPKFPWKECISTYTADGAFNIYPPSFCFMFIQGPSQMQFPAFPPQVYITTDIIFFLHRFNLLT